MKKNKKNRTTGGRNQEARGKIGIAFPVLLEYLIRNQFLAKLH